MIIIAAFAASALDAIVWTVVEVFVILGIRDRIRRNK